MFKNKKYLVLLLILCAIFLTTSCAPGNYRWDPNVQGSKPANFWAGLWHGLIIFVTFIISLFNKTVKIYEVNNYGWSYNLGYIVGLMIWFSGSRITKKRRW
jgi:hypothetical protein